MPRVQTSYRSGMPLVTCNLGIDYTIFVTIIIFTSRSAFTESYYCVSHQQYHFLSVSICA